MERKEQMIKHITFMIKTMLLAYMMTAGLLLLLAFILYKFSLSEKAVTVAIIAIYVVITFLCGLLAGKHADRKRFLWGILAGVLYFLILMLVSVMVDHGVDNVTGNIATVFVLCAGSGMLGAMLS